MGEPGYDRHTLTLTRQANPQQSYEEAGTASMYVPSTQNGEFVPVTIPASIIEKARKYPAIDWNAIIKYAVEKTTET